MTILSSTLWKPPCQTNILDPGHSLRPAGTPSSFSLRFSFRIVHNHADCTDAAPLLQCRRADKTQQFDGRDDEQEREARELAATRIQAVARGKRYRQNNNNSLQTKAVTHNENKEMVTGGVGGPNSGGWHQYGGGNADNDSVGAESGGGLAWSMIKSESEISAPPTLSLVSPETAAAETRERQEVKLDRGVEKFIVSLVDGRITASEQ